MIILLSSCTMKMVKYSNEICCGYYYHRILWSNGLHGWMMLSVMCYNLMKLVHNSLKLPVNFYSSGLSTGSHQLINHDTNHVWCLSTAPW